MRTCLMTLAVLLMFSLTAVTAQAKASKSKGISGSIVSVATDGSSLVVQSKGKKGAAGTQKTITITPSTTIEINDNPGKATDLRSGMTVKIKLSGDSASDIKAGKKSKKKK